ncbi:lipopolysaccharide biosynthesis protein [Prevotella sp. E15-22]|uniref:lipopolysaccharide biosynthesis protein n=1 Tax=Prevotella sp. E15-22 TaxID=2937774 RepID=UPI00205C4EAA|nr:lipopolysaccharide biosynthesis protein [Prevotella sp. E15-22]UPS44067.1 lipopolysaccharide biosynthesis protein [Prevotella sp. E15-22]
MDNLKEKTAKGLFWGALNNGTIQVLNVLIGIMLGRKLSPEEWAPIGMIAIFSAIAGNLQSSGFSTAIVNMKAPTSNDYNAVFWFNTLVSAIVYLVLFACAPWIAWFFEQPCLTDLSRFIFLAFFISSFGISTNAYMMKNMMQREMTIVGVTALIISGITAIILAFQGYSYWSLAWQQVINAFVLVVGRWVFVKWRPSFKVDFTPIRRTFRFSMNILITMIINTVNNHILTFVFGKLFTRTPQVVGNFFQAFKWDTMAYQTVGGTIEQVAQPVLVNLRDNEDESREVRVFRKMMRFTAFLAFPAMFGLSLVSEEFILATIGQKWIDCVPLLRVLCIGGAFMPFYSLYKNLIISQGRADLNMWLNISQIVLQFVLIFATYQQGILMVVYAYSILNVVWLLAWQFFAHRMIGLRLVHVLKDTLPFALISGAVMVASHFATMQFDNVYLLLTLRIVMAAVLYVGVMKLLRVKIMDECIKFLFKKTSK